MGNFRVFSSQDPFPEEKNKKSTSVLGWSEMVFAGFLCFFLSPDCETLHVNSIGILPVVKMIKACT